MLFLYVMAYRLPSVRTLIEQILVPEDHTSLEFRWKLFFIRMHLKISSAEYHHFVQAQFVKSTIAEV